MGPVLYHQSEDDHRWHLEV